MFSYAYLLMSCSLVFSQTGLPLEIDYSTPPLVCQVNQLGNFNTKTRGKLACFFSPLFLSCQEQYVWVTYACATHSNQFVNYINAFIFICIHDWIESNCKQNDVNLSSMLSQNMRNRQWTNGAQQIKSWITVVRSLLPLLYFSLGKISSLQILEFDCAAWG